jgi:hypothetical protein
MPAGSGGGYSARANSARNMGLYGNHPALAGRDAAGARQGDRSGGAASAGGETSRGAPSDTAALQPGQAGGAAARRATAGE